MIQQQLLQQYSNLVKPGGILVYVTCSILPEENGEQISQFMESEIGKMFELKEERNIWASESGFDGFYMAKLQRSN